ncbi:Uncharacterised protein [Urinicoccus massiliensis]|uniref:Uncharacterized protein n=1 Tax=Urinicoccus massiliensis TaxID=1723382 RepID=A0A8H2M3A0_9FIRM|nr:hypothetical protein [Urinicoccus massiliensis]VFB15739.1 Uncharacterised protein [Urinicoccus massiliensis]
MKFIIKALKLFSWLSIPMTILVLIGKFYQPEYQMVFSGQGYALGKNVVIGVVVNLFFNIFLLLGSGLLFSSLAKLLEAEIENK